MKTRLLILISSIALIFTLALSGIASADSGPVIHKVKRGESLSLIAKKYGVTVSQLMRLNHLRNANRIYVGQRLVIRPGVKASKGVHIVRRGDTLSGIAQKYGVSVAAIQRANRMRGTIIYVGQRLKIPTPNAAPGNDGGQSSGKAIVHVVRRGETLGLIAQRYGVSVAQIAKLNGIKNTSLIRVGQKLVISGNPKAVKKKLSGKKKFVVDISAQKCWRYQGDKLLNTWRCSTGRNNSTKTGHFRVQSKLRKAYGSTWNIWMPYWLGIYWSGPVENGIHGLPWNAKTGARTWAGLVGTPITYGCVMLNDKAAKTLWEWADIGTTVIIRR